MVPQDMSSVRLCCGGSENKGVSTVVGGHPRQVSCWSLFQGFLGSVSGGHPMPKQHTAVGQQTGETANVERWKNTLQQHLARFVHMTLSFSRVCRNTRSLPASLLHQYNLDRAVLLKRATTHRLWYLK